MAQRAPSSPARTTPPGCTEPGVADAANVAALAAPLVRTRFVGCVGDDPAGDGLERMLSAAGVEVCLERRGRTGSVVVVVHPDGERTMFPDRAAAAELTAEAVRWAADVDVLHLPAYTFQSGSTASSVATMAGAVRGGGGAVTVDASAASLVASFGAEEFFALLASLGASVLFANRDESDALDLCARALPPGLTAIVKDGPRPVTVLAAGAAPVSVPVRPVEDVRDTTGAGDAFAAGTLAAWLGGAELPAACCRRQRRRGERPQHAGRRHPPRSTHMIAVPLTIADEVADAVAGNTPVVALESTIFSNLGLPTPHNREALQRCSAAIREAGAVPAITAVLDGVWRVGLDDDGRRADAVGHAQGRRARPLGRGGAAMGRRGHDRVGDGRARVIGRVCGCSPPAASAGCIAASRSAATSRPISTRSPRIPS